jgi:hypothetical protein
MEGLEMAKMGIEKPVRSGSLGNVGVNVGEQISSSLHGFVVEPLCELCATRQSSIVPKNANAKRGGMGTNRNAASYRRLVWSTRKTRKRRRAN